VEEFLFIMQRTNYINYINYINSIPNVSITYHYRRRGPNPL